MGRGHGLEKGLRATQGILEGHIWPQVHHSWNFCIGTGKFSFCGIHCPCVRLDLSCGQARGSFLTRLSLAEEKGGEFVTDSPLSAPRLGLTQEWSCGWRHWAIAQGSCRCSCLMCQSLFWGLLVKPPQKSAPRAMVTQSHTHPNMIHEWFSSCLGRVCGVILLGMYGKLPLALF